MGCKQNGEVYGQPLYTRVVERKQDQKRQVGSSDIDIVGFIGD